MEETNAQRCQWVRPREKEAAKQSSWSWTIVTLVVVVALVMCFYFYYHYSSSSTSRARSKNNDDLPPSTDKDDHTTDPNAEVGVDPFFTPLHALGTNSARTNPALL